MLQHIDAQMPRSRIHLTVLLGANGSGEVSGNVTYNNQDRAELTRLIEGCDVKRKTKANAKTICMSCLSLRRRYGWDHRVIQFAVRKISLSFQSEF